MKTTMRLVIAAALLLSGRFLQAGTLTVLHSFSSDDGLDPASALIQGSDGDFYGTTESATHDGCFAGSIFKIDSTGSFTFLHSFGCEAFPNAPLIQASDGFFYGTTSNGGSHHKGSVYRIDSTGAGFTTLHSFNCTNGCDLTGGLVEGTDGNFYGTSSSGGAHNGGTVFKMTPSGTVTALHSFNTSAHPFAGLIQASDGLFYGTTTSGGANQNGSIFRVSSSGTFKQIHSFNNNDGDFPIGRLLQASDGKFYGTTLNGGSHGGGVIFEVDSAGNYNVLVNFGSNAHPRSGLIQLPDGLLYGTNTTGGAQHVGAIFKLDPSTGTYTRLFSFSGSDGSQPFGELLLGSDGLLYDTTLAGGAFNDGEVFSFTLP